MFLKQRPRILHSNAAIQKALPGAHMKKAPSQPFPSFLLVLVHCVFPIVVVSELFGIRKAGDEDPTHPAHPQILRRDRGRVLRLDL